MIEIEYKLLRKQQKLMKGLSNAPEDQRQRTERLIAELKTETGLDSIEAVEKRLGEVREEKELMMAESKKIPDAVRLRAWFLRPLLSHLDHPTKLHSMADPKIGVAGLEVPLMLHVPEAWGFAHGSYEPLRRFFSFKAYGKGSKGSAELEQQFLHSVSLSHKLPFQLQGLTDLPLLHYNIHGLWSKVIKEKRPVSIVSGICPLSIITDEIDFFYADGRTERPTLGFEPLSATGEEITELRFPPRPIAGDYVELVRVFSLAKLLSEQMGTDKVNVKLWLPEHEYRLVLKTETFSNLLEAGVLSHDQVSSGLSSLSERYRTLIRAVCDEFKFKGKIIIKSPDENALEMQKAELAHLLNTPLEEIINDQIPLIYGLYAGTHLRRELFGLLAFKHMQKEIEDPEANVLHLENSYELWPSLLAARFAEAWAGKVLPGCSKNEQVYSFLCAPSIPSPSLKYMRTLNAPYEHKIYLACPTSEFEDQLTQLQPKYIDLMGATLPGIDLSNRLRQLNDILHL